MAQGRRMELVVLSPCDDSSQRLLNLNRIVLRGVHPPSRGALLGGINPDGEHQTRCCGLGEDQAQVLAHQGCFVDAVDSAAFSPPRKIVTMITSGAAAGLWETAGPPPILGSSSLTSVSSV